MCPLPGHFLAKGPLRFPGIKPGVNPWGGGGDFFQHWNIPDNLKFFCDGRTDGHTDVIVEVVMKIWTN